MDSKLQRWTVTGATPDGSRWECTMTLPVEASLVTIAALMAAEVAKYTDEPFTMDGVILAHNILRYDTTSDDPWLGSGLGDTEAPCDVCGEIFPTLDRYASHKAACDAQEARAQQAKVHDAVWPAADHALWEWETELLTGEQRAQAADEIMRGEQANKWMSYHSGMCCQPTQAEMTAQGLMGWFDYVAAVQCDWSRAELDDAVLEAEAKDRADGMLDECPCGCGE